MDLEPNFLLQLILLEPKPPKINSNPNNNNPKKTLNKKAS